MRKACLIQLKDKSTSQGGLCRAQMVTAGRPKRLVGGEDQDFARLQIFEPNTDKLRAQGYTNLKKLCAPTAVQYSKNLAHWDQYSCGFGTKNVRFSNLCPLCCPKHVKPMDIG